ncbi:MAG: cupin domain-containing protein [Gammaproteobacteria bacterium]|nr:cupin domain-containing protein [Gammaproteobacteria bacterium]MDH3536923.1 cupin domain-containing protein [Gammaproteobacteria bacterium]
MWQLQGFDHEEFISRYWQKRPYVLRNAFVEFESPVSPEELAGLACEEDVHCRLVIEKDGATPWQLRYGPFEDRDFLDLPETHYSLLVSECEKWLPELAGLLDQFRFIPDWRIDDLMLSYAPRDGSVGPHVDEYDVFLLQAMGARRWQYCESKIENPALIPNLDLAILQEFTPDQEIVLNQGDLLYLPPGFAHHGVALERCMTYSIGFRAPDAVTTLESFALEIERIGSNVPRYRDGDLELERHHAEITDAEISRFRALAIDLLEQSQELWQDAVGKMLSDSPLGQLDESEQPVFVSDLQARGWTRHPETRLFYHHSPQGIRVYYNGRLHELPQRPDVLEHLQQLCDQREWPAPLINACIEIEPLEKLLVELATNGAILPLDE